MHGGLRSLEKANNRLVLRIRDSIKRQMNTVLERTVDFDVVVILAAFYHNS